AVAELAEAILRSAPGVRVLATSREPLRAEGERLHRLQPLDLPAVGSSFTAAAPGAGSVATTSNPRARYCAAQLAPMMPVPTMAMRRMGLSYFMSRFLQGRLA